MTVGNRATRGRSWWSEPGPESCGFCHHAFHVEIGYHCVECDRPVCPLCVVTVRERHVVVCPECEQEGDG